MAAKKKATGMASRQSFLDRSVINENKEIMRFNEQLEREARGYAPGGDRGGPSGGDRPRGPGRGPGGRPGGGRPDRPGRRPPREVTIPEEQAAALRAAVPTEGVPEQVAAGGQRMVERLVRGERLARAADVGWAEAIAGHEGERTEAEWNEVRAQWRTVHNAIVTEWATTHPDAADKLIPDPKPAKRKRRPARKKKAAGAPGAAPAGGDGEDAGDGEPAGEAAAGEDGATPVDGEAPKKKRRRRRKRKPGEAPGAPGAVPEAEAAKVQGDVLVPTGLTEHAEAPVAADQPAKDQGDALAPAASATEPAAEVVEPAAVVAEPVAADTVAADTVAAPAVEEPTLPGMPAAEALTVEPAEPAAASEPAPEPAPVDAPTQPALELPVPEPLPAPEPAASEQPASEPAQPEPEPAKDQGDKLEHGTAPERPAEIDTPVLEGEPAKDQGDPLIPHTGEPPS